MNANLAAGSALMASRRLEAAADANMGEAEAKSAAPLPANNNRGGQSDTAVRFKAFISYRHVAPDKIDAKWLQSKLETFRVPKYLVQRLACRQGSAECSATRRSWRLRQT